MITVIIEIPKGDTVRRHLRKDAVDHLNPGPNDFVELGSIYDVIPLFDGKNSVNYGYIPGTYNANDNDELDVIVYGDRVCTVGEKLQVEAIALLHRADGDDKIVAVEEIDADRFKKWEDIPKDRHKTLLAFFGYKSPITSIDGVAQAEEYIQKLKRS